MLRGRLRFAGEGQGGDGARQCHFQQGVHGEVHIREGSGTRMARARVLRVGPHVDLEVARRGGGHRHERPSGVAPLPRRWRGRHQQPGLRSLVLAPARHHRHHGSGKAGPGLRGVALRPRSDDGCDAPWGTQGCRRVEGQAARMVTGLCARGLLAFALQSTYHGRLSAGRGETPSGVSPSPSPPWGSPWAASCGHATQVPLSSVPQAPQ